MVKGKGTMRTYFLEENGGASLDQIMGKGQSKASTPEKTDRCKSPPETPTNNMPNGKIQTYLAFDTFYNLTLFCIFICRQNML